ncbi:MAG: adenylate/guanylate cyclase domain-containing protein, partial [Microvirga sp.]
MTVLFADVAGFTTLAERIDPEDVRAFQNALFEMFAAVIARFDGFVEKFVGDAVMAVFGAPVAHEDDPERALNAALDMVDRSTRLGDRWAGRLGQPVGLHIGVHTGPVMAGSFSDAAGAAYAVTGDTVNTTARLLASASGTILVSDATYLLTRHRFSFEPARDLVLRGKAEPIAVRRLLGALAEPQSARGLGPLGLETPMVGRVDELDQLLAAFERMQRGRAQVVSVMGEAGAGKSRLIAEFLQRLDAGGGLAGTTIRRTACSSLGEPAYGAFGSLFREAYGVEPRDALDVAHRKLVRGLRELGADADVTGAIAPVLSYLLGVEEARPRDFEPEQLQRQIVLAARMLVERRLHSTPLLIIVEDFHWVDAASADLLRNVADHLADRCLMLLLCHRPEARPPAIARAAQSVIRLAALSPEETQSLVQKLFPSLGGDVFAQMQKFVAARAGGNPLFAEEIVRNLVSKGILVRDGERWACAAACEAADIPPTLQGLLLSRVDSLPFDARRVLHEAAVLGVDFEEAVLLAVADNAGTVEAALERLLESDLIRQVGRGRDGASYRFTHAIMHEAVYQNLLLSRRIELHERAGRAIERVAGLHPERLSDLEALGHHWSFSQDKRKGARFLTAAGDRARAVYANDDAIRHYERALRTLADHGDVADDAQAVRERLADLLALTGRRAEALAHYAAVRQDFEKAADRTGVARMHRKIGGLHWEAGDRESAGACFTRGLEQLGEEGNSIERAQLFQEIGRLAFRDGDIDRAIAWAERALAGG